MRRALGLALMATAPLGACSLFSQGQQEALLNQNLAILCPAKPGTSMLLFTEADGDRVLMRFKEVRRVPEAGGWRLTMHQSFALENGSEESREHEEISFLYSPQRLEMGQPGLSTGALVALAPLRLGAPAPAGENMAALSAIAPLDLPYGRIPWAAAFEQKTAAEDRVATAWFAPGMGLVRYDEKRGDQGPQSAQLKLLML